MFEQTALIGMTVKLNRFALRLTRNTYDAEDLLQSTLLRVLEKKDTFELGTNLFSWASKIMFNLFASSYRRKKKFETQYDPDIYMQQLAIEPVQENNADLITVGESMQKLTSEHQEILMLVCIKGMKYDEVATLLKIPVGTVRSRLSRARLQLKILLTPNAIISKIIVPIIKLNNPVNNWQLITCAA